MEKNGFTLIELLIVIAISMILIGFAITGSKSLQAQQVLQSSVSNFISKLSFIKSEAVSGTHSFNGNNAIATSDITNWVYGFYVVPATSTSSVCASSCDGYDIVMAVKDITAGSQCNDQNFNNTPPSFDNTFPPVNNSLYNSLNTNNFTGSVSPLSSCIGNSNGLPSNSITPTGYTYFHGFFPGVEVSSNTFPMFEEISGYVYLYNNSSPYTVIGSSSQTNQTNPAIFTFKYQGYQENVYINDKYNTSQSDSIYSGGIRYE